MSAHTRSSAPMSAQKFSAAMKTAVKNKQIGANGVKVLKVAKPSTVDQASSQGTLLTLALRPQDAEKVVFAQEHGTIWIALLAPGQPGQSRPPLFAGGVLK